MQLIVIMLGLLMMFINLHTLQKTKIKYGGNEITWKRFSKYLGNKFYWWSFEAFCGLALIIIGINWNVFASLL